VRNYHKFKKPQAEMRSEVGGNRADLCAVGAHGVLDRGPKGKRVWSLPFMRGSGVGEIRGAKDPNQNSGLASALGVVHTYH